MPKIKKIISGKIISPKTIEIVDANRSGLIPGQKVLVYTTTGHDIVSASGRIIGKKEKVLGSGEVKIDGNKLIVRSPTPPYVVPSYKATGIISACGYPRLSEKNIAKRKRLRKRPSLGTVLIKPIDE